MSAPEDRLLGDTAAENFQLEALAMLSAVPLIPVTVQTLALAVVALGLDRQARIELLAHARTERID